MRVKGSSIMKKLISFISFVLVLVMLTCGATVFGAAFKDFKGTTYFGEAYGPGYGWDGYPDGTFKPDKLVTRAEFICYLFKFNESNDIEAGRYIQPVRTYNNNFSDVPAKSWYYKSVVWAYERGFINGVGNVKFDPYSTIGVFEYAIIMYRYYNSFFEGDYRQRFCTGRITEISDNYSYYGNPDLMIGGVDNSNLHIPKAVLVKLPKWFEKETSLENIIGFDIWIGGDPDQIDMTKFSATRGELYKHSHIIMHEVLD